MPSPSPARPRRPAPASTSTGAEPVDATRVASHVARWISIAAHPFVTTLLLVAAVERYHAGAVGRTTAAVALLVVLPVAALIVRQVRRGAWGTVDASRPAERPILFAVVGAGMLALVAYLAAAHPGSILLRGALGVSCMVVGCAVVTRWIKVSLHLAAAALAATALVRLGIPPGWPLAALLPPLAWSRVALGRHRWAEVALGAAIGAVTALIVARPG